MTRQHTDRLGLEGVGAILPTPLEGGKVAESAVSAIVDHALEGGCDTLWVLGGGGEQPSLDNARRKAVMRAAVVAADGRRPVVAGIGDCGTEQVHRNLAMAVDCGVDAVQVMEPYYYRHSVSELHDLFLGVADVSPVPVLLYLHHERWPQGSFGLAQIDDVIGPLAKHPRIVGVKDAAQDFRDHLRMIVRTRGLEFSVLTSAGRFLGANLLAGGAGGAFHEAVVAPKLYARVKQLLAEGAHTEVAGLMDFVSETGDVLGSQDPASAKAACSLLGLCRPDMVPPLRQGTPELMHALSQMLDRLSAAGLGRRPA